SLNLLEERLEVYNTAVSDNRDGVWRKNAGGQELELILFTADDDRMAGVVATVWLHNVVNLATQKVCGLTLALVAPLGSDDHDCWHGILPLARFSAAGT